MLGAEQRFRSGRGGGRGPVEVYGRSADPAAADATGHFKMTNLPVGKQLVLVSAVGFKAIEKEVQLISNKSVTILVELEPDYIGIEQIVVSANRNEKSRKETATIVNSINPKLFDRMQSVTLSEGKTTAKTVVFRK